MLDIRLLGPPRFLFDGTPLPAPPRRTIIDVWVFLLLHRGTVLPRERVAFALWPDAVESMAHANLRRHLHALAQYLPPGDPPWILKTNQTVAWNPASRYTLDIDRFDDLFARWQSLGADAPREQTIALLAEATGLYRGDLCAGMEGEWLAEARRAARWRQALMLERLGVLQAASGAFERAVAAAETRLALDPASETAHRLLMWVRYASGDRMGALRQYEECRGILRTELDADPTPEMEALCAAVRDGRPVDEVARLALPLAVDGVVPGDAPPRAGGSERGPAPDGEPTAPELPVEIGGLVGRDQDLAALIELVGRHPLVTLTGFGGMGKTRLALAAAHRLADRFPGGAWWVDLAPLSDPALVAYELAIRFGVRARSSADLVDALVEALSPATALIVLDNCEHVLGACADIALHILQHCPRVRIVATSTERLHIAGETVRAVQPMAFPAAGVDLSRLTGSELGRYSAVQLFLVHMEAIRGPASPSEDDLRAIAEICRALDGIPLAIELAAARAPVLSVREITALLEDSLGLLTVGGAYGDAARHQALRSTVAWSYDLLAEADRRLLGELSIFQGGCSLDAVQALAAGDGIDPAATLDALGRLIDRSLVTTRTLDSGATRYGLLEAIRRFGLERAAEEARVGALRNRHAEIFAGLSGQAAGELTGPQGAAWRERLEIENDNLRGALRWSLDDGSIVVGLRLGASLWRYWYLRGSFGEGAEWLSRLLAVADPQAPTRDRAEILRGAGVLADAQSSYDEARRCFLDSLAMFRALGADDGAAAVLDHLTLLMQTLGEGDAAADYASESLKIKRARGDQPAIAVTLRLLANLYGGRGEPARARDMFLEGLAILRRIRGRPYDLAQTLLGLGSVQIETREIDEAQASLEEALVLFRDLRDHTNVAHCLGLLGTLELARERFEQAGRYYAESMAWAKRHGYQQLVLGQLFNLSLTYRDWGKLEASERFGREALDLARGQDDPVRMVRVLGILVSLAIERDDLIAARVYGREMRSIALNLEQSFGLSQAFGALGELAVAEAGFAEARALHRDELDALEDAPDRYYTLEALDRWVVLLARTDAHAAAIDLLAAVDNLRQALSIPRQAYYRRRLGAAIHASEAALTEPALAEARTRGSRRSLAEAVAFARATSERMATGFGTLPPSSQY